jgi:membrane protease YdiL (CAAX protease family)
MTDADGPPTHPVARWRWWIHLILIGGYFIPLLFLSGSGPSRYPALTGNVSGLLTVSTINLIFFAIVFAVGWIASRASSENLLLPWRPGWAVVPLGFGYSIAFRIALGMIVAFVVIFLTSARVVTTEEVQSIATNSRPQVERIVSLPAMKHDRGYFWLTLTFESFVVAGLREELWRTGTLAGMRALWPRFFSDRSGEIKAVLIIAVLFGAAHYKMGLLAAIFAFVLGIFLGVVMVVHRSIWPAVFAHGFFDALSFALLPYLSDYLRHLH